MAVPLDGCDPCPPKVISAAAVFHMDAADRALDEAAAVEPVSFLARFARSEDARPARPRGWAYGCSVVWVTQTWRLLGRLRPPAGLARLAGHAARGHSRRAGPPGRAQGDMRQPARRGLAGKAGYWVA